MLGWLQANRQSLARCAGEVRCRASRLWGLWCASALISLLLAGCEGQAPDAPAAGSAAAQQATAKPAATLRALAEQAKAEQGAAERAKTEQAKTEQAAAERIETPDLAAAALAANCYTCHLTPEAPVVASAPATPQAQAETIKATAIPTLAGWQADEIRSALARYQAEPGGQGVMHRIARALDAEAIDAIAEFIATHPCAGLLEACSEP